MEIGRQMELQARRPRNDEPWLGRGAGGRRPSEPTLMDRISRLTIAWAIAFSLGTAAIAGGCNPVADLVAPGGGGGGGGGGGVPPPSAPTTVNQKAPRAKLGGDLLAPGTVIGLTPDEIAAVKAAAPGSRLAKLRDMVAAAARLGDPVLKIEPGKHLIDRKSNQDVPASQALDLGFLIQWNELMDALGLAYALTGDAKYAQRVDAHLLPWANYSPPLGAGLTPGGEPGIYHRNFFGCLRAAEHCLPALTIGGRQAAVKLAITLQDRMEDWWARTPWERGNHAAATAQTGLLCGLLLQRAAALDPALIAPATAAARLEKWLNAGDALAPETLVGGEKRVAGLIGFGKQAQVGILTPAMFQIYAARWGATQSQLGASMDFLYKPKETRFSYHALLCHHVLTSYWAVVRNGLDRGALAKAAETRAAIGLLLEFGRPYFEAGKLLPSAGGKVPLPTRDARTREIVAMAARLFPEKAWLESCRRKGDPVHFSELYAEVASFQ